MHAVFTDQQSPDHSRAVPRGETHLATAVPRMSTAADSAAIASATEPLSAAPTAAAIRAHSAPATYPGVPRRNTVSATAAAVAATRLTACHALWSGDQPPKTSAARHGRTPRRCASPDRGRR
jgi:hypothetical protein